MMKVVKESQSIPPPEDTQEVFVRTVDDAPAVVFVDRCGGRIVVPVTMREVPERAVA